MEEGRKLLTLLEESKKAIQKIRGQVGKYD